MPSSRGGRPKTGAGHRDDAMLSVLDFLGLLAEFRNVLRTYHRDAHARLDDMEAKVRESAGSWRYGELVDEMTKEKVL